MLNHISTIWEYHDFLTIHKSHLDVSLLKLLKSKYQTALSKLRKLDISLASDILFPLYSHTGRPAIDPAVLVRSFVLMNHLKYSSIKLWCDDLANDSLFQYLIGSFDPPNSSSHYDFIISLTGYDPHLSDLAPQSFITKKNLRISLPNVKNLLILPKMTLLLFAINTEMVLSSTEVACYLPCNLFLTLLPRLFFYLLLLFDYTLHP